LPGAGAAAQAAVTDALVPLLAASHAPATRVAASWAAANVCHAVMTERPEATEQVGWKPSLCGRLHVNSSRPFDGLASIEYRR
jgi:hypothetical protein